MMKRGSTIRHRALAWMLTLAMVVSMAPATVFAEEIPGAIGYAHVHDGSCGYVEAVAEVPCDRGCTDMDGDGVIDHVVDCAYRHAVEGQPCMHVHDESCGGLTVEAGAQEPSEGEAGGEQPGESGSEEADPGTTDPETTELGETDLGTIESGETDPGEGAPEQTELSEDLSALQERIHALPTGDEYRAMSEDEQETVYMLAAEIAEEYAELSEEDQAKLDITRMEELFAVINEGIAKLAAGDVGYEPLEISAGSLNGNAIWGLTESWSRSITLDNSAAFYAQSSSRNSGVGGLPVDGDLTTTNGTPYQLAYGGEEATAYDGNDCIWLHSNSRSVTMNLQTIGVYQNIYVLATAGGPGSGNYAKFNVTLNYTDETTGETTYKLYDWYDRTDVTGVEKYYPVMRRENSNGSYTGTTGTTNGPILQSATISADSSKLLKSITFNLHGKNEGTTVSGLYCGIFAVTGATPAGVPQQPKALSVEKIVGNTDGSFTARWNAVEGATGYRIDVATDRKFTDILPEYNNLDVGNVTESQL